MDVLAEAAGGGADLFNVSFAILALYYQHRDSKKTSCKDHEFASFLDGISLPEPLEWGSTVHTHKS